MCTVVRSEKKTKLNFFTYLLCGNLCVLLCSIFQVIGCLGALRLNERLLNAYWLILLALLAGDAVVGGAWLFRYQRIAAGLGRRLEGRLSSEYGEEGSEFRGFWDGLQGESR